MTDQDRLAEAGQKLLRAHFALKIIREFCMDGFNATVSSAMCQWMDRGGVSGPVPWPKSAFFDEWAKEQGWSNIDGHVGFRLTMQIVKPTASLPTADAATTERGDG